MGCIDYSHLSMVCNSNNYFDGNKFIPQTINNINDSIYRIHCNSMYNDGWNYTFIFYFGNVQWLQKASKTIQEMERRLPKGNQKITDG